VAPFERRLYLHAFGARSLFFLPVLIQHIVGELSSAGIERGQLISMSILSLFAVGIIVAEYPSGLFADWAGRTRSLVVGSALYAGGVLLYLIPGSILAFGLAQFLLGVGAAFQSGADSALLHARLDHAGDLERYPGCLARLRFSNLSGIVVAGALGGMLYAESPASVFVLTSLASLLSLLPLLGMDEGPVTDHPRRFGQVLRESLGEMRRNTRCQALVLLGGIVTPYFIFCFWATQSYLVEIGAPPALMGYTIAGIALLQAATMPLSSVLGWSPVRQARATALLAVGLAGAFVGVAVAQRAHSPVAGALTLVAGSACLMLYRNLVNMRLQGLIPDAVRASIVSFESWLGSVWYAFFFPIGGWLIDTGGLEGGYTGLAVIVVLTALPLLLLARRRGTWSDP
jgi:MFS family permease